MIEKKDWEVALKQYEAMHINSMVNMEAQIHMMEFCKEKIAEFPEEDPMPEEAKEIVEAVK